MCRQFVGIKISHVVVLHGEELHGSKKPKFEQMEHAKKWGFFTHFLSFLSYPLPGKYSCAMIGGLE